MIHWSFYLGLVGSLILTALLSAWIMYRIEPTLEAFNELIVITADWLTHIERKLCGLED